MDEENETSTEEISSEPNSVRFILLLIIEILSMMCTILLLIYLVFHWQMLVKRALRNHVLFVLVLISFLYLTMDLPFTINSYRLGHDQPRNLSFCLWWYLLDYVLTVASIFLTAMACVQRHILIFHAQWLYSSRVRCFAHFLPILICISYPMIFYFAMIVLYPCDRSEVEDSLYCLEPCYGENFLLFNLDWIFNTACPLLTIILANFALIIRVIRSMRKIRRRQSLTWKRQRKLALQLLALSNLYVLGWAPSTILSILQSFARPTILEDIPQLDYFNFLTYFVCPLQSFICLLGLPELIKSVKGVRRRFVIVPIRAMI